MRGGFFFISGLFCIALLLFALSNAYYSKISSFSVHVGKSAHLATAISPCEAAHGSLPAGEKYMLYSPHSGFSNQVSELKNALLIASLLDRTLVLPPIFDHHAVALGSCPKFRVHEPHEMRSLAWSHISDLIRHDRYLAIADVIDLSSVVHLVKLIDFRIFSILWCGVDVSSACSGSFCRRLIGHGSTWGTLQSCGLLLSRPNEVHGSCVYGVNEDCRTTIWVHDAEKTSEVFDAPAVGMSKGKHQRSSKDIVVALGSGSEAGNYQVISFGSLFSAEYKGSQLHVDLGSSRDRKMSTLLKTIKFLPFTPPIVNAGKLYAEERISQSFICAQLRLLDGQFKNHWDKTFTALEAQLKLTRKRQGPSKVLHVFVMTDLPQSNWTKTYLGDLVANKSLYKVHTLDNNDPLIQETANKLAEGNYGLRSGFLPAHNNTATYNQELVTARVNPDICLFIEEVICSCATLGFVGTTGSTLSANILQLRTGNLCAVNVQ